MEKVEVIISKKRGYVEGIIKKSFSIIKTSNKNNTLINHPLVKLRAKYGMYVHT